MYDIRSGEQSSTSNMSSSTHRQHRHFYVLIIIFIKYTYGISSIYFMNMLYKNSYSNLRNGYSGYIW